MPYIKSDNDRRQKLRKGEPALTAGELNYQIFYHIKHYGYDKYGLITCIRRFLGKKPNYQRYNDMTGCLIRCYKEIKRRLKINLKKQFIKVMERYDDEIAKYEDEKITENGDVE